MRIDVLLVEKGLYSSRAKAKEAVQTGRVFVDGKKIEKPSFECDENAVLNALPFEFVSRGGFKLQKALEDFSIDLNGKVVLDIGASTGGFSDVCLQAGAKKIYAVDTGVGQLVEKIKNDARVVNLENTNYLNLSVENDIQFVCIDVSFVSLTKLAPKLASDFVGKSVEIVALIKPQFECGPEYAKKHKGIVKDEKMHEKIIENISKTFEKLGFLKKGLVTSPIKGGDGNTEFLIYLTSK